MIDSSDQGLYCESSTIQRLSLRQQRVDDRGFVKLQKYP
jgi:hypothetical protein